MSTKNDGKDYERLVQLIERSISPNSVVYQDLQLPIINSRSGKTTQCDVVIITGKKPRETTTIVEIQDRNEKVKPNTFRGWEKKLEEVGAQHLLAVSRQDFPESIKEKALLSNGRIRLITLQETDVGKIPFTVFNTRFTYRNFDISKLENAKVSISRSEMEKHGFRKKVLNKDTLQINENCFSLDKSNLTSLYSLCKDVFDEPSFTAPNNKKSGKARLEYKYDESPILYLSQDGIFIKIGIELDFTWSDEAVVMPTNILSYEQSDFGVLAWVVQASYNSSKGRIWFKVPFVKSGDGYSINEMLFNLPPLTDLAIKIVSKSNTAK